MDINELTNKDIKITFPIKKYSFDSVILPNQTSVSLKDDEATQNVDYTAQENGDYSFIFENSSTKIAAIKSVKITNIDKTAPSMVYIFQRSDGMFEIKDYADDDLDKLEYSTDGENFVTFKEPFCAAANTTIYARGVDKVGNISKMLTKVVNLNKTMLQMLYNNHKDDVQGDYTDETWNAFKEQLENVNKILEDENTTQYLVNNASNSLKVAMDGLKIKEKVENKVDITILQGLYDAHKNDVQGNYTNETWNIFKEQLENANKILSDSSAKQDSIDEVSSTLKSAIEGLKIEQVLEIKIDKSVLQGLYDAHKNDAQGEYTDETWNIFKEQLENANKILNDSGVKQDSINSASSSLNAAIDGLKIKQKVEENKVDKTKLQSLYDAHKNDVQGDYTNESWQSFTKELENANKVLNDLNPKQDVINNEISQLQKSLSSLEIKKDNASSTPLDNKEDKSPTGEKNNILLLFFGAVLSILGVKKHKGTNCNN